MSDVSVTCHVRDPYTEEDEQVWSGTWSSAPAVGDTFEVRPRGARHGRTDRCFRVTHVHRIMFESDTPVKVMSDIPRDPRESSTWVWVEEITAQQTNPEHRGNGSVDV